MRQREIQGTEPDPVVYVPYFTGPNVGRGVAVIVRTSGETAAAVPLIRQAVLALDADIPVFNVRTMDELLAQRRWQYRVFGGMFAIFAAIALLLAAVGLYAMAYSVTQRRRLACAWCLAHLPATWSGCFSDAPSCWSQSD